MGENKKGIGFIGLIGMVISSCIGSGIFALTGQLAAVSSPGASLIAWAVVGVGFLMLALSLSSLGSRRPDLVGIFQYAEEGFGPFSGFLSGWGYWLSAWLGNVAFATMMMSTLGYFFPAFLSGNSIPCIIVSSIIMWLLTLLVIRGAESASVLNAVVMIAKVLTLVVFIAFAIFLFSMDVFTVDFWGNVASNMSAAGQAASDGVDVGSIGSQVSNCLIVMMWVFIGIEGATVMSSRAKKKSDVGRATVIGLICLLVIYVCASILPYGYMSWTEIAKMDSPAMLYVFDKMAPGWGGPFVSIAIIVAIFGSWLSFTMLPAETSSDMAERHLLPASWGKLNKKGAPQFSLIIVGCCTQAFLLTLLFTEDAYNFALSMCTVSIVITWALAAAFQVKFSAQQRRIGSVIIGALAVIFLVVGTLLTGWGYLLLTCIGYVPGLFIYAAARRGQGLKIKTGEKVAFTVITVLAVLSIVLLVMGVISI